MPQIVPATPGDAGAVAGCVRAAYAGYVERIGREPAPMTADYQALIAAREVWVIRAGEGISGSSCCGRSHPRSWSRTSPSRPTARARGWGGR